MAQAKTSGQQKREAAGRDAQAMAKAAGIETEITMIKPQFPEGAKPVDLPQGQFFNFERMGQAILGTLLGTSPIATKRRDPQTNDEITVNVDRWNMVIDDTADVIILPDHYDLVGRLNKLAAEFPGGPIQKVWIQYLGRQKAKVPSGFLHRYAVAKVAGEQQPLVGTATTEGKKDVPF